MSNRHRSSLSCPNVRPFFGPSRRYAPWCRGSSHPQSRRGYSPPSTTASRCCWAAVRTPGVAAWRGCCLGWTRGTDGPSSQGVYGERPKCDLQPTGPIKHSPFPIRLKAEPRLQDEAPGPAGARAAGEPAQRRALLPSMPLSAAAAITRRRPRTPSTTASGEAPINISAPDGTIAEARPVRDRSRQHRGWWRWEPAAPAVGPVPPRGGG